MTMLFKRMGAVVAGLSMSTLASAALVDATFDVTINQRLIGKLLEVSATQMSWTYEPDPTFTTPVTFSLRVRFDSEAGVWSGYSEGPQSQGHYSTFVSGTVIGNSPFSAGLTASMSGPSSSQSQISIWRIVQWNDAGETLSSTQLDISKYITGGGGGSNNSYSQSASLYAWDDNTSHDVRPLLGDDFVNWLKAQVGAPGFASYYETFEHYTRQEIFDESGQLVGASVPDFFGEGVSGTMALRSVNVVPIPAIGLWMQAGCVATLAMASLRRRWRK